MPACPDDALPIDFSSPARRVLPHNYVAVALAVAAFVWPASAQAACWFDAALTQQARQIAQRLMPELQTVPEVSVCTPEHFPARVADHAFLTSRTATPSCGKAASTTGTLAQR